MSRFVSRSKAWLFVVTLFTWLALVGLWMYVVGIV